MCRILSLKKKLLLLLLSAKRADRPNTVIFVLNVYYGIAKKDAQLDRMCIHRAGWIL